jgi:hypothetical protein
VLADEHHEEVRWTSPEMRAIKAWIDLNCPLWPDYIYRPDRLESLEPRTMLSVA